MSNATECPNTLIVEEVGCRFPPEDIWAHLGWIRFQSPKELIASVGYSKVFSSFALSRIQSAKTWHAVPKNIPTGLLMQSLRRPIVLCTRNSGLRRTSVPLGGSQAERGRPVLARSVYFHWHLGSRELMAASSSSPITRIRPRGAL